MPVSIWNGMEDCLAVIVGCRPAAALDAGAGFGLWGCLLRQYLDVWSGRLEREQWATRIDAVEMDSARVQPHARHLYTDIVIGDVREVVPRRAVEVRYDVILFGDVIEHLPKDDGIRLLEQSARLATRLVVVRIPLGNGWRREGREEPDHHRSRWYAEDLRGRSFGGHLARIREYDFLGNPYGLVTIATGKDSVAPDPDVAQHAGEGHRDSIEARLDRLERRLERLVGT
jgi:hypothetical protein